MPHRTYMVFARSAYGGDKNQTGLEKPLLSLSSHRHAVIKRDSARSNRARMMNAIGTSEGSRIDEHANPENITRVILQLAKKNRWRQVEKVFAQMESTRTNGDHRYYNAALKVPASHGRPSEATKWLVKMKSAHLQPEAASYNSVIQAFAKQGQSEIVAEWIAKMETLELKIDVATYTAAMIASAKQGDAKMVEDWFRKMEMAELKIDLISCSVVLNSFAKQGYGRDAAQFLAKMDASEVKPDGLSYNTVMQAFARQGDGKSAGDWLAKMEVAKFVVDVASYNTIINLFAQEGDGQSAVEWLIKMEDAESKPNAVSYSVVINALAQTDNGESAAEWLAKMEGAELKPDLVTYNAVILAFAHEGNREGAAKWLARMEATDLKLDVASYNAVIIAFAKQGDGMNAEGWFAKIEAADLKPNVVSYSAIIKNLQSNDEDAVEWLDKMDAADLKLDIASYGAVMCAFAQQGDGKAAEEFLAKWEKNESKTNDGRRQHEEACVNFSIEEIILYSDDSIIVVNKPPGMLCVPGAFINDSVASRVAAYFHIEDRARMVAHRLDQLTSGVLVFARNMKALRHLHRQFAAKTVTKKYVALVDGLVEEDQGEMAFPIRRDMENPPKQLIDYSLGKEALTYFEVPETNRRNVLENSTLIDLYPYTGRTHQLRIHLATLGHPIYGDDFYASDEVRNKSQRLCLHAEKITFKHPATEEEISFTVPHPFHG